METHGQGSADYELLVFTINEDISGGKKKGYVTFPLLKFFLFSVSTLPWHVHTQAILHMLTCCTRDNKRHVVRSRCKPTSLSLTTAALCSPSIPWYQRLKCRMDKREWYKLEGKRRAQSNFILFPHHTPPLGLMKRMAVSYSTKVSYIPLML